MDDFRTRLRKLVGEVFDAGRHSVPEPEYGDWPSEPSRTDEIEAVEKLVSEEILRIQVGPPMAFLGCVIRNDYTEKLYQVTSISESDMVPGGGYAQLISLDDEQDFVEASTVALLRDYAVVGAMEHPGGEVIHLGD